MKPFLITLTTGLLILLFSGSLCANEGPTTGIVAETMDAGGYTYIRLEQSNKWIATETIPVVTGSNVSYVGGMEMRNFHSKALGRTFPAIWFVQNLEVVGGGNGHGHHDPEHGSSKPASEASVVPPEPGEIEPLPNGSTVAELNEAADELKDTNVRVRAMVMKVSTNIMGKNWITLQDGTGAPPGNKLIATSTEMVEAGDLVIASGTLRKDVDLGSGYLYKVLLEDAGFSK